MPYVCMQAFGIIAYNLNYNFRYRKGDSSLSLLFYVLNILFMFNVHNC